MKIAAIVLAAGLSRRFGEANKLLARVDDQTMIRRVVGALIQTDVEWVVVVTGHQSALIESELKDFEPEGRLRMVYNPRYALGMSTSIARGARYLEGADGCMICLGDLPYLTTDDYQELIGLFGKVFAPDRIIIPTFDGKRGHPVFFGSYFFGELQRIPAHDQGAKELIGQYQEHIEYLPVTHNRILKDIDFRIAD